MFAIIIAKVITEYERRVKCKVGEQIHSFYCEQSCTDAFYKVETSFLENFFRYNIADYFKQWLVSVEEQPYYHKIKDRQSKTLLVHAFQAQSAIQVAKLNSKIYDLYTKDNIQTIIPFRHLFTSCSSIDHWNIQENQLVFLQTRMRADIEKIQNLPCSIIREIEQLLQRLQGSGSGSKELAQYSSKSITLMLVYFEMQTSSLQIEGTTLKGKQNTSEKKRLLKIHVYYTSHLEMIDKFKRINIIQTMEYINDLLIQLSQLKREKRRAIRIKQKIISENKQTNINAYKTYKWLNIVSITSFTIEALYLLSINILYILLFLQVLSL